MTAVLKIYGDIGESIPETIFGLGVEMCSAKSVSEFLDANQDASDITVRINSRGGDVQEGWAIYDLLTNSGKKIKTIGEGKVYSIATIIFLAGSDREIMKNADGLIHNPFIPPYTLADQYEADDLLKIAESLRQEEEKILNFYAEKTGTAVDKLAEYMKEDTKLSAEDMLTLGFATKIIEPVKAYAYMKPKINLKMKEDEVKTLGEKLDAIIAKFANFSRIAPKDQTFTDADGKEFTLVKEEGSPAVSDEASPDGTYKMSDGRTIVIADGKITEIKEPVADKTDLEVAQERIVELEAEVSAFQKEKEAVLNLQASFKTKEAEAKEMIDELSKLRNTWKPEGRSRSFETVDKNTIDLARAKELTEKLNNAKPE